MNEVEKKQDKKVMAIQAACSICEEDGKVRLRIEMPGLSREDIEVSVEKNELSLVGRQNTKEVQGTYLLRERPQGEYYQRFIIDESIDRDKIEAVMADGVLTLTLSKIDAAKPRKVQIA
ncbi:hypothetical protein MASR2M78_17920 [Treponema sp.]